MVSYLYYTLNILYISSFVHAEYAKHCGRNFVNRGVFCCIPIFDCEPGNEIIPCTEEYKPENCTKCKDNKVQSDYISSMDIERSCFNKTAECTANDMTYSRKPKEKFYPKGCKCDILKCYIENHGTCKKTEPCKPGQELLLNGTCRKCPTNTENLDGGCDPCTRIRSMSTVSPPGSGTTNGPVQTDLIIMRNKPHTMGSTIYIKPTTDIIDIRRSQIPEGGIDKKIIFIAVAVAVVLLIAACVIFYILIRKLSSGNSPTSSNEDAEMPLAPSKPTRSRSVSTNTEGEEMTIDFPSSVPTSNGSVPKDYTRVNINQNNVNQPPTSGGAVGGSQQIKNLNISIQTVGNSTVPHIPISSKTPETGIALVIPRGSNGSSDDSLHTTSLKSTPGNNEINVHSSENGDDVNGHATFRKQEWSATDGACGYNDDVTQDAELQSKNYKSDDSDHEDDDEVTALKKSYDKKS